MLLTILWHERIQYCYLNSEEIFRFEIEHDAAFELQCKKGEWRLRLSGTLQFEDDPQQEKVIDKSHDQFSYTPFYQNVDLFYSSIEGFGRMKTYCNVEGCLYLGPVISDKEKKCTEIWAQITKGWPKYIRQVTTSPGVYVNGVHCYDALLKNGDLVELWDLKIIVTQDFLRINQPSHYQIELKTKKLVDEQLHTYQAQRQVLMPFKQKFQFERTSVSYEIVFPKIEKINLKQKPQNMIFSIGPAVMMASASLIVGLFMLKQMRESGQNLSSATMMILLPTMMIFSAIFWPVLQLSTASISNFILNWKRYKKVMKILATKQQELSIALSCQKQILDEQLFITEKLVEYLNQSHEFLYSRQPTWNSFGKIVIGIGQLTPSYSITLPEIVVQTKWDQKIIAKLEEWKNQKRIVKHVPISICLLNYLASGWVLDRKSRAELIPQLLFQMSFWHSPCFLHAIWNAKIEEEERNWLQWLPHFRLDEMRMSAMGKPESFIDAMSQHPNCTFLVFCDQIENFEIYKKIQEEGHIHLYLIYLCENFTDLPYGCNQYIILTQNKGKVLDELGHSLQEFELCKINYPDSRELALTYFRLNERNDFSMKSSVGLFDLLQVEKVNFSIEKNWNKATLDRKIEIPIGLDDMGKIVYLDLHENGQGPHGLIAGMTGSGKSELLLSLILSAACLYSPMDLQFVILDFKGGSLINQLIIEQLALPHLIASMDNMNPAMIKRSFLYLKQECQRRQLLFQNAQKKSGSVINSIDTYRIYQVKDNEFESLAHLVILVDEFAELKQQEPEFMQDLIRIARIGRSLGLHLILATQKPSGIVDEQMWSNFSFKLCLKVAQGQDSLEMIHDISASLLQQSGECYFLSGQQKIHFKAAWAHQEANKTKKELILLDQQARPDKQWQTQSQTKITQAFYLLKKVQEISEKRHYSIMPLWPPLPHVQVEQSNPRVGIWLGKIDNPYERKIEEFIHPLDHGILLSQNEKMIEHFIAGFISGCLVDSEVIFDVVLADPLNQLKRLATHPTVLDHITLQEKDVLERLLNQLVDDCQCHQQLKKALFLVIVQPQIFLQHLVEAASCYSRLQLEGKAIGCYLLFVTLPSSLPLRFWQSLAHRYVMGLTQASDILLALEKNQKVETEPIEEGWIYAQQPLQFFLPSQNNLCFLNEPRHQLARMPSLFNSQWITKKNLYLGIDSLTCQPVYFDPSINKNLLILSQSEELLQLKLKQLKSSLQSIKQLRVFTQLPLQLDLSLQEFFLKQIEKYVVFQSVFKLQQSPWRQVLDYRTILWLGEGIQDQYLFAMPIKCENADAQLRIYINHGKISKMKGVGE